MASIILQILVQVWTSGDQHLCTPDLEYLYKCKFYLTENTVHHHHKDHSGSNVYEKQCLRIVTNKVTKCVSQIHYPNVAAHYGCGNQCVLGLILQPLVNTVFKRRRLLSLDENFLHNFLHYKLKLRSMECLAHLSFSLESYGHIQNI